MSGVGENRENSNFSLLVRPLHNKLSEKYFNREDIKLVQKLKQIVQQVKPLVLSINTYYKIIQTDACSIRWAGILL